MAFLGVKNRAESTLASGITDVATELTVATGEGVKFPASNFHITIEDEILLCSSRSTDVFTIEREAEGTTGVAHSTGAAVELRITAGIITELQVENLPLAGGTMSGDIQLGETDIKLDAVLSGDEKWSGIVTIGTLGSTVAQGETVFLASDGKWDKTDGILDGTDVGFKAQLGICLVAGDDTDATEILTYGKVRSAAFPAFTVGAPVYLSDTAGDLVVAQPSTENFAIRICGYAISETDLLWNPDNSYIVHK